MGIKTVPHSPYSPDLAPYDFWLFPKLRGCRYETIEEIKEAVTKLLEWYNKCIAAGGDYFEGDKSFMCVLSIKVPIRKKSGTYLMILVLQLDANHLYNKGILDIKQLDANCSYDIHILDIIQLCANHSYNICILDNTRLGENHSYYIETFDIIQHGANRWPIKKRQFLTNAK